MSCENLPIPKPATGQCPTNLFGIPYQAAGRTVNQTTFPISGIVIHCYDGTASQLCNEMKCRTRSSVISGSVENSYHYGIGASGSGDMSQYVDDGCVSWAFGTYKQNSYVSPPPPNTPINWPVLQAEHGINTTPDLYVLNVALAMGTIIEATLQGCYECPTSSGLPEHPHSVLVQLLAYLANEHSIPIDSDHITFHDLIHCGEGNECVCTDLETLLTEVAAYCPPCEGDEAPSAPEARPDDCIQYVMGVTEACCPTSPGCYVKIPWDACFVGDLAIDGTLDNYILGLTQDPVTMQWCLTRGCLGVVSPIIGCGTVLDPLRLDRCSIETWLDSAAPLSQVNRVMGTDDNGCWTLESPDSFLDRVICANPENSQSTPEWVLAKTDETCPEWVTPQQIVAAGLAVLDSDCIDLTFINGQLTADIIISPDAGNIVTCRPNGVYAPVPEWTAIDGNCVDVTIDNVANTVAAELIVSPDANNILECRANGAFAGFAVQNTDCINLAFVGGVLTATPAISIDLGGIQNVLACLPSGMYVPRGANALVNGPLVGNGSDINPLDIDFSLLDAQDLCDLGQVIPAGTLQDFLGRDLAGCVRWQTVADVIAGAISVSDTNCIDLTWAGNNLSADPIISPMIGGVLNVLTCEPTGLYVPIGAGLSVSDTACINLTLVNGVLSADFDLDPAGDNQITCTPNGVYVPIGAGLTVTDTDCIDLDLVGGDLTAHPILAGAQAGVPNTLVCITGQGLYVPETANLNVIDTACINLTLAANNILSADLILDPSADNQASCIPAGLYVPPTAGLEVFNTDCIALALTNGNELRATPILAGPQAGIPNGITCLPGQGLYVANNVTGLEVFSITDDQANTQIVSGGNVVLFEGINGATQRVSGVDTVTVDGHHLYASVAPAAAPPYDTNQIWEYYNTNTGISYTWNPGTNKWDTCAQETNAVSQPGPATCGANQVISPIIDGIWCPGTSIWTIPAGNGPSSFDLTWELVEDCEWRFLGNSGQSVVTLTAPLNGNPETVPVVVPFDNLVADQLGGVNLPGQIIIQQDGCYEIEASATILYNGINFEAALTRLQLRTNGVITQNLADYGLMSLTRPPGNAITIPMHGSTIKKCYAAGTVLELATSFSTNFGGQTYDIIAGIFTVRGPYH